jgi:hypothetical protein
MSDKQNKPITVFISYSWDSEEHKAWVKRLADRLNEENGIDVWLDQYQLAGTSLTAFMQDGLKNADKVLVIGTPNYKKKAESHKGETNVEDQIINIHMSRDFTTTKFIPILRKGSYTESFTILVRDPIGYDFSDDASFESELQMLIEGLTEGLIRTPKDNQTNQSILEIPWTITFLDEQIEGFYRGPLIDNKPSGKGHFRGNNKTAYDGFFENGKFHGNGKLTNTNGVIYEGEFIEGALNGDGSIKDKFLEIYKVGSFKNNELDGLGIMVEEDGCEYIGIFIKGELYKGKIKRANGAIEDGEFKDGKLYGTGTYIKDGTTYDGEFANGSLDGFGTITWANGNIEEGCFVNNVLNGRGKRILTNGIKERGVFKDGLLNGGGIRIDTDSIEEGFFIDGVLNGEGTITYSNGTKEIGSFMNGELNGEGKRAYSNGLTEEGIFKDGKLIEKKVTCYHDR